MPHQYCYLFSLTTFWTITFQTASAHQMQCHIEQMILSLKYIAHIKGPALTMP